MSPNLAGLPQRYLRTPEAARFVGLSIRTLEKHRIYGTGPRYSKLGGRVVYRVEDLQAWVDRGAKASTSDPGVGTVRAAKGEPQRTASISSGRIGGESKFHTLRREQNQRVRMSSAAISLRRRP